MRTAGVIPDASIQALLQQHGLQVVRTLPALRAVVVKGAPGANVSMLMDPLGSHPSVDYVEHDYPIYLQGLPSDPEVCRQWGLLRTEAHSAWDRVVENSSIEIAVVDGGIDATHADLRSIVTTTLAIQNPKPAGLRHGTHVAGILGAEGNNGIGGSGVLWKARIVDARFYGITGSVSEAIDAIEQAERAGVRLFNCSWTTFCRSRALHDTIARLSDTSLFVVAAGNSGQPVVKVPTFPACYDLSNIVAVAATHKDDTLAGFSAYGVDCIDLAAPGLDILSTIPARGSECMAGTSMATPFVTGAAALVWEVCPSCSPQRIKEILEQSVDPTPSLQANVSSGGRLNIGRAVGLALAEASYQPSSSTCTSDWSFVCD
ncbi:MAG TPA: S8 family serine peptidase [Thermoanaerobaculia bacterium]|nr:S8 family serine peptidase [Thermoanaerobaculia bacterium]